MNLDSMMKIQTGDIDAVFHAMADLFTGLLANVDPDTSRDAELIEGFVRNTHKLAVAIGGEHKSSEEDIIKEHITGLTKVLEEKRFTIALAKKRESAQYN